MIQLSAQQLSKRYVRQWIFRKLEYTFTLGKPCAITGPNGSGKSTLLKVLSGFQPATEGSIAYTIEGKSVPVEEIFPYISIAAPYLELIEDFTLGELLKFHFSFKQVTSNSKLEELAERMYLDAAWNKPVKHFSSGMKQRLRLGLAFYAATPLLFLDEPTSNLDIQGQQWYEDEISLILPHKVILVASNQPAEYQFCSEKLHLPDWKIL